MEDITSMYGGMNAPIQKTVSPSISFRPKEVQTPLPENAKIISETKDIYVQEIENGYVISMDTNVCYTCKEDDEEGEMEEGERKYAFFSKKVYTKEKPIDIKIK
jgi:hypothetical protein